MAYTECIASAMVGYMDITCTNENNDQHISDMFPYIHDHFIRRFIEAPLVLNQNILGNNSITMAVDALLALSTSMLLPV